MNPISGSPSFRLPSIRTLDFNNLVVPEVVEPSEVKVPPSDCCGGDSEQITWWYVRIGNKQCGIHVNWKNWRETYTLVEGHSREIWEYFHEYFHHVVDSWKQKHNIRTPKMDGQYGRIWNREQIHPSKNYGLLLGEALAENYAENLVWKKRNPEKLIYYTYAENTHPSYDRNLGSWGWLSLSHVYQIINDNYEIFKQPMPKRVDERQFVENLNEDYEQYQDELFSVKNGFAEGESAFKNTKFPPSKIPFFVHECSEDWYDEVRGFVGRNDVSMPKFV